ncbi:MULTISPECIES: site-2 protease family protein [Veillonella]|jgi:peptidase, M50 family|uniref:Peptidase n=1 Tax=Veillonella tobetsuensis TaxID=1110546 RepID=A0A2S7ZQS7_9FIRM|nr:MULTISPECIES: site-2 protease family protein [Veillonella]MBF1756879.1 site-2 protease family protein [Veillonella tobetsuensis]MDU5083621.1 site-2 protease family protein [Veillonella sp.]PQL25487.1 site-2 protease family protein [Veillonella tobetsuensis]GCL67107.1 peptidase [Veillonella tobetsuensis]GCL68434.1 peptidase [Veillonella tobetsuensis]
MILSGLSLIMIIASIPALIIAAAGHEYAHAKAADLLGDPTPRMMGRLTMNPFVHLDLVGSLALIIGGFGWAKPVIVNPTNFKDPRTDDMIVSIAGPMANILMAFIAYVIMRSLDVVGLLENESLYLVLLLIVVYNINFAILNMMPIPPLDGSHILMNFLPLKWQVHIARFSIVSLLILIAILNSPIATRIFVPLQKSILGGFESIVNLVL